MINADSNELFVTTSDEYRLNVILSDQQMEMLATYIVKKLKEGKLL